MTPEQRASHAREAMANPILAEVLKNMLDDAVAALAYASAGDHDLRQAKAAEIRATRDIQDRLSSIATVSHETRVKSFA